MPMTGFFCQDDYLAKLVKLTDEEVGRLFRALMIYHITGEVANLDGRESIAFDFIREDIDRTEVAYQKKCDQARENRRKGLSHDATEVDSRQRPSTPVNGRDQYNKNKININKKENVSFLSDDEAAEIQGDHDKILDAAQNAGFKGSPSERAGLLNLYAMYGTEKVLAGIQECVTHAAPNLAYLTAVLKGTGKKKADARDPHGYEQRDYSGAQAEAIKRMMSDDWGEEGASNG